MMMHMHKPTRAASRAASAPLRPGVQHRMLHTLVPNSGPKGGADGIGSSASPGGDLESALWQQYTNPVSQSYQSLSSTDPPPADVSPAAAVHMDSPTPDMPSHHHPCADQPDPRSSPMALPHAPVPGTTSSAGYAQELQSGSLHSDAPASGEKPHSHEEPRGHDRSSSHTSTGGHPQHATPGEEGVQHFSHHAPFGTAYTRDPHNPEVGFMGNERAVAASDAGSDAGLQWEAPTAAEHHHHPPQQLPRQQQQQQRVDAGRTAENVQQSDAKQQGSSEGRGNKPRGMFSP